MSKYKKVTEVLEMCELRYKKDYLISCTLWSSKDLHDIHHSLFSFLHKDMSIKKKSHYMDADS